MKMSSPPELEEEELDPEEWVAALEKAEEVALAALERQHKKRPFNARKLDAMASAILGESPICERFVSADGKTAYFFNASTQITRRSKIKGKT